MPDKTLLRYDLVLLPSAELAERAIGASKTLEQYDSIFTLEDGRAYPHLSLYMFWLYPADVSVVKDLVADIARKASTIHATATKYCLGKGYYAGYIDAEYVATNEMLLLQRNVVKAINPVGAVVFEEDSFSMQSMTQQKLRNIQKYGYAAIGESLRPHMTLTRLTQYRPDALELLTKDVSSFSGAFDKIGVFETGDHGTCVRRVAEYMLLRTD